MVIEQAPRVTAVIRAKDKSETIRAAIDSVMSQSIACEVIVVDSGSRDATVSIARDAGATVVTMAEDDFSYGRAINVGIVAASTPFVLLLSAHCQLPTTEWLRNALAYFDDERVAGLNGTSSSPHVMRRRSIGELRALELGVARGPVFQDREWYSFAGFSNHASLLRRSVALEFPFDEQLAASEDKEWANRVSEKGYRLAYVPGLSVSGAHRRRAGARALFERATRESAALANIARRPIWSSRDAAAHAFDVLRTRRGVKRLAPLRPANLIEMAGRVYGGSQQGSATSAARPESVHVVSELFGQVGSTVDHWNAPLHDNSGDSAIWLGELMLMRQLGHSRRSVRSYVGYAAPLSPSHLGHCVAWRGGGYFGNQWQDELQHFYQLCHLYRGRRVILMPQTIGDMDDELREKLNRTVREHGDVHLVVRDRRSFEIASEAFDFRSLSLCPDSAESISIEYLRNLSGQRAGSSEGLRVIARRDEEGDGSLAAAAEARGVQNFEYVSSRPSRAAAFFRWAHEFVRARSPRWLARIVFTSILPRTSAYDWHARAELKRLVRVVAGANVVVTDRLHTAILSSRLGVRVLAVDTGYGKLRTYFDAWPSANVTVVDDAETAFEAAQR